MSLFQTDSGISTGRLNPSGPTPPPPKIDWSERLASQREKEEAARQKEEGGGLFGGFLGDVLRVGSTSLLPDIPFIPDFIASASIDNICDHIASTRFGSGSNTSITFQNIYPLPY